MPQTPFSQGAAILAGLSLATVGASAGRAADQIETPDYEVIAAQEVTDAPGQTIEVRQYAPMLVAEVTVAAANRDAASSKGFRPLADYIFGNNRPKEEIAMTAPVTTTAEGSGTETAMTAPVTTAETGEGDYTVRFMMPDKYTLDTLPEPVNPEVTLREMEARALVALRFTGARTAQKVKAAEAAVTAFIEESGLAASGPFITAGYDGPSTAPENRRWEVQRPIASVAPVE